jgi:hypothetical protein
MANSPSAVRLILEAVAVSLAAIALVALLYSPYWRECCGAADMALVVALYPGLLFAMLVGGGVHASTKYHYYVGVVVQFLVLWAIVRATIAVMKRGRQAPVA